ncbi:hypothetical protein C0J52_12631 [Blattella germanica]|nr:hypothetical protein C0J52_12631 [Blattella germanica]
MLCCRAPVACGDASPVLLLRSFPKSGMYPHWSLQLGDIAYVLTLSALGFGIFMNVALILGSIYKKTTLLYIWFVVYILVIIVMTIIVIVNSFSREVESSRRVPRIAFSLVYKLIILYFLVVVHSYYKEIKEERAREYYDNVRRLKELQRQHQLQQFQCQQYHQPPMNVFTVSSAVPTAPLHTPEPTAPMEPLPAYLPPIRPVY